jgi:hypothetical protein
VVTSEGAPRSYSTRGPSEKCPQVGQLAGGLPYQDEAFRHRVYPDISREELWNLIEGSTVKLEGEEHRAGHSEAGDFVRWGRLGGLETLRRYGRPWFALLGRRRWGHVSAEALACYRAELAVKAGAT